jgi:transcription elongation factor GreA
VRSNRPGVYVVELAAPSKFAPLDIERLRAWIDRVPGLRLDGERPAPSDLADRIRSFWVPDAPVLFVGSSERSVGGRVAAMVGTALGDARPYAGAHWLQTLQAADALRVWWSETPAPQEHEDALLDAFAAAVPPDVAAALPQPDLVLPFAVLRRPTGERRQHGISDALLAESTVQQPRVPVPKPRATSARSAPRAGGRIPKAALGHGAREVRMSAEGKAALEEELRTLREDQRPGTVKRVTAARELGDLRENAEYQTSRQELGFIDGRIQQLEGRLRNAVVVEDATTAAADLGSTVVVEAGDMTVEYRLVDSSEANLAAGRLSTSSPVGRALLGRTAGDEVIVTTPGGQQTFRVVEVR